MFTPLTLVVAFGLFAIALWGLGLAVVGSPPNRPFILAILIAEAELLVHAAIAGAAIIGGHRPDRMGEYLGYLLTSVMLLFLGFVVVVFVLQLTRAGSTRWDSATMGAVALAVGVAVLRLLGLW